MRYSAAYWKTLFKAALKNDQARKTYKLLYKANEASEAAAIITPIEAIVKRDCAQMCDAYDIKVANVKRAIVDHAVYLMQENEGEIDDDEDEYFSLATKLTDIV